jgi:gliding motility-associated-like protein
MNRANLRMKKTSPQILVFLFLVYSVVVIHANCFAGAIRAANNPPQFVDSISNIPIQTLNIQTNEDVTVRIHLHIKDVDPDGLDFTSINSLSGKGSIQGISIMDTSFRYVPNLHVYGIDTVKVIVHDNGIPQLYDTLNVIISITHINHFPIIVDNANNQIFSLLDSIAANTPKQICLKAYDVDNDNVLISFVNKYPNNGVLSGIKNLCFNYKPNNGFVGLDSAVFLFSDNGTPVLYNFITVRFKVFKPNTPPTILDQQGYHVKYLSDTTLENTSIKICLNATDPENDGIKIKHAVSLAGHIQLDSLSNQNLCFYAKPIGPFFGNDSIKVVIADDGYPVMYDSVIIRLNVWHPNLPPEILDNQHKPADTIYFDAFEREPIDLCLSISDAENDKVAITNIRNVACKGTITISGIDTCMDYVPPSSAGKDRIVITVCDNGIPSRCDSAFVIIRILPRLIIAQGISPNEDGHNDTWLISGIERHPNNMVTIFSRWGDVVYKVQGYDNMNVAWKGEINSGIAFNDKAPDGTYFYVIELEDGSKISGFIVLKR